MRIIFCLLFCLICSSVVAHQSSRAWVVVEADNGGFNGSIKLDLTDLDLALDIDSDADNMITWRELKKNQKQVKQYILQGLRFLSATQNCPYTMRNYGVDPDRRQFVVLSFRGSCGAESISRLEYNLIFRFIKNHQVIVSYKSEQVKLEMLDQQNRTMLVSVNRVAMFRDFMTQGISHILTGWDHLLFLLCLVLPYSLIWGSDSVNNLISQVTIFTLSHSISIAMASTGLVAVDEGWVEVVIAASIVAAAGISLLRVRLRYGMPIIFLMGLVHGFGFASFLQGLQIQGKLDLFSMFAFNFGIEIGQLLFILCLFLLWKGLPRSLLRYKGQIVSVVSCLIMMVGMVWMVERLG